MDRSIGNDPREPDERDALKDSRPDREASDLRRPVEVARLREMIDSAAKDRPSFPQFFERLEQLGVRPVPSLQKSGRLNGMSYELNGIRFKGSDLGRSYTAAGLEKQGVRYDSAKDASRLRDAALRAREHPGRAFRRPIGVLRTSPVCAR